MYFGVGAPTTTGGPVVLFTDLTAGPKTGGENNNGAYVRIFGKNFGSTTGTVTVGGGSAIVRSWDQAASVAPSSGLGALHKLDVIVIQLGANAATGNIVVTNGVGSSNGVPFTVDSRRITFMQVGASGSGTYASPFSPSDACADMVSNGPTICYLRSGGGSYTGSYTSTPYSTSGVFMLSEAYNNCAFIGFPGETVTLSTTAAYGFGLYSGTGYPSDSVAYRAQDITIANLTIEAETSCVHNGGNSSGASPVATVQDTGGKFDLINCSLRSTYGNRNTLTGIVTVGRTGTRVLGNWFHDTGAVTPYNNNHGIYVQLGCSDVEVAHNKFSALIMGHVIQCHTDVFFGVAFTFTNISVHDNVIESTDRANCRGIVIFGNATETSTGKCFNNVLYNVGQDYSAIMIHNGTVSCFNNTVIDCTGAPGPIRVQRQNTETATMGIIATIYNNLVIPVGTAPDISSDGTSVPATITARNNSFYGSGTAYGGTGSITSDPLLVDKAGLDFRLQSGSPCRNAGTSVYEVPSLDILATSRPQGSEVDMGAYEYVE